MKDVRTSFVGKRRILYLLITLISLVAADGVISRFLVKYGLGSEWNPFLRTFVSETNFLLIKLAGALLATLILWDVYKFRPRAAMALTVVFLILYTGIVFWNLGVYLFSSVS